MLKDVRGFIFDIDGVLHITMRPIPGAPEFFGALRERGVPHRFLTNSTIATCATLARRLQSMGFGIPEESILTASRATAEYVAAHFPGQPCYLLATGDTVDEFRDAGVELVDVVEEPAPLGDDLADLARFGGGRYLDSRPRARASGPRPPPRVESPS